MDFLILYPDYYYKPSNEGIWKLGETGMNYAVGTIFSDTVYHLYQSRFSENVELFEKHCKMIIEGNLNMADFIDSRVDGNSILIF